MTETHALAGRTIGVTAERRREELGSALERHGASVMYGPAIRIVPLADDSRLREATTDALEQPIDVVVGTTGVGFTGWVEAADGWGDGDDLTAALEKATILARGPKVRGAVRARGLREAWSPESESTAEVQQHLLEQHEVAGKRVVVQLHGDPLLDFIAALRDAGAEVIEVPVYRWEPPADPEPLRSLIQAVADETLDAVTFTSAPAATNFLRTATESGVDVRTPIRNGVLVAAVGPVTASPLVEAGLPVVQPERHRLGALVKTVVEQLGRVSER